MNRSAHKITWDQLHHLLDNLEDNREFRPLLMIALGAYTGLRYSDWSTFKWYDLITEFGTPKEVIHVLEQKTKDSRKKATPRRIIIPKNLQRIIMLVFERTKGDYKSLIFQGERGPKCDYPISNTGANMILKKAGAIIGADITTHSLRKTWGYQMFSMMEKSRGGMEALLHLQAAFGHHDWRVTRRYLGLEQEVIDDAAMSLE